MSIELKDPSLLGEILSGAQTGPTFDVLNPGATHAEVADGTAVIAKVPIMGREDAKAAIERADIALKDWKFGTTALFRSNILSKWSALIKENAEDIAKIMTYESGKPLAESLGEITYGTSYLDFYAGEALRPNSAGGGFFSPTPFTVPGSTAPRGKIMAMHEAIGVCAFITPWNFPIAMITRKAGPALAVGCTAVLKPSEMTPLTAVAVGILAKRAGIPDGVFEVITTDRESSKDVGAEFCSNPIIKKISFTGSTFVGKLLMKQSADTVKKLSLELGGNNPFIIFEDADIDQAVDAAIACKFRNAGQTCVCADRFLVHEAVEEEFVSKFAAKTNELKVGYGFDGETTMGPLISAGAAAEMKSKTEEALKEGATCVTGGAPHPRGPNFFEPTILTKVDSNSRIWCTETFGPVAAVKTFATEEEAEKIANDSPVGLAAYFCTKDMARVFRFSSLLEVGIVGVNEGIISNASAPFGGVKESGLGREGSILGIEEYLETKYVCLNV